MYLPILVDTLLDILFKHPSDKLYTNGNNNIPHNPPARSALIINLTPVSYTHLDVYKRQSCFLNTHTSSGDKAFTKKGLCVVTNNCLEYVLLTLSFI